MLNSPKNIVSPLKTSPAYLIFKSKEFGSTQNPSTAPTSHINFHSQQSNLPPPGFNSSVVNCGFFSTSFAFAKQLNQIPVKWEFLA